MVKKEMPMTPSRDPATPPREAVTTPNAPHGGTFHFAVPVDRVEPF